MAEISNQTVTEPNIMMLEILYNSGGNSVSKNSVSDYWNKR